MNNLPDSLLKHKEKGIWQRRFWEHLIRDDDDLQRHLDYIHYNPIKHSFVMNASDWKYSSFDDYVQRGVYTRDWGESASEELKNINLE